MKKAEITAKFRQFARTQLSPTQAEREMISGMYEALRNALGDGCLLIGSYARFTASRPVHDLDILFRAGRFDVNDLNPQRVIDELQQHLLANFRNPTKYRSQVAKQSHSVTISFVEQNVERFAVDIVPAFTSGLSNEFGDDIFWVPEIVKTSGRKRKMREAELAKTNKQEIEWWIKSDPLGYIKVASRLNSRNSDFRKVTKLIKKWKYNCEALNREISFKSFHIEQAITQILRDQPDCDFYDLLYAFFCAIPEIISRPQIRDRANNNKFIDDYLANLTVVQRQAIIEARDAFLMKLEMFSENSKVGEFVDAHFYKRKSVTESYLFDSQIPVLLEKDANLRITANVQPREGGFRAFVLDAAGLINIDRKISFTASFSGPYKIDLFKWRVKNDDTSLHPRGEITDHSTLNNPEITKYTGSHFVECFAINGGSCIARAKQDVVVKKAYRTFRD